MTDAEPPRRSSRQAEQRGELIEQILDMAGGRSSWWTRDAVVRLPPLPLAATGKIDKLRLRREHGSARVAP